MCLLTCTAKKHVNMYPDQKDAEVGAEVLNAIHLARVKLFRRLNQKTFTAFKHLYNAQQKNI